ncbi:MAG: 5-(carboxyamino)imidazole ribonucleotide mutase [Planctomycetota bacterium]|jgi:5-(carboxyamino)imidazole ribonucleotide mutase|nr:5-(carboxyamino)imidazole ribonucleotide mutase [Planctomycetota bacterium]
MKPVISVIMGSSSDFPRMEKSLGIFREFALHSETHILSAHRTPDAVTEYAKLARSRGVKVIIAAAGSAAALPGAIAAHTTLPVIGVPLVNPDGALAGLDSLLSMTQMPAGIPVAVVAASNAGPENAALLAIAILAIGDDTLNEMLVQYRQRQTAKVLERDRILNEKLRDPSRGQVF